MISNHLLKQSDSGIFLNIGCGLTIASEWMNVDISPTLRISKIPFFGPALLALIKGPHWPKAVHYGDIVKGLNIRPETCSAVFASHVLEHLSLPDFHKALEHIYLYLKPGGIFRAIVPDLRVYAVRYLKDAESSSASEAAERFMKGTHLGCQQSRKGFCNRLREALSGSRHQWMWDFSSLEEALRRHGFRKIRRCVYGDWAHPHFQLVEEKDRHQDALCIEGIK